MRVESDFIFDGIPSSEYNVKIYSLGDAPDTETLVSNREFTKVIAPRDTRYRIIDVSDNEVLTFKLQIFPTNDDFFTDARIRSLTNWLFNKKDYKKLQFLDIDISHLYYNCILKDAVKLMAAEKVMGIEFTVECDSSGAWTFEETKRYDFSTSGIGTIFFNNVSSDIKGIKPFLTVEMFEDGNLSMTNLTTGQLITINNLSKTEKITMDCGNQVISSDLDTYLFDDFNGEFLYLPQGLNRISVNGKCKIIMTYQNQVKVGG